MSYGYSSGTYNWIHVTRERFNYYQIKEKGLPFLSQKCNVLNSKVHMYVLLEYQYDTTSFSLELKLICEVFDHSRFHPKIRPYPKKF
jgi:hypothetical protein